MPDLLVGRVAVICVVETGCRVLRFQCATDPVQIEWTVRGHAGADARVAVETDDALACARAARSRARRCVPGPPARPCLAQMQTNKTDQNDTEGLAQIMRTGWYRSVHAKSLDARRARLSSDIGNPGRIASR